MRLARPLLPLPHPAASGARPDQPERPGHSTNPTSPPVTVDTPGERTYATGRGQVTTGIPTVRRQPPPVPSPDASIPRRTP